MFDAPRTPSSEALTPINYVQPTLGHGLRIWWAFFWPTNLISMFLVIVVNFWLRYLYQNS